MHDRGGEARENEEPLAVRCYGAGGRDAQINAGAAGYHARRTGIDELVVARVAVDFVTSGAADQEIVALAAQEYIVARAANDDVVAVESTDRVAVGRSLEDVVARGAGDRAIRRLPGWAIGTRRGDEQ